MRPPTRIPVTLGKRHLLTTPTLTRPFSTTLSARKSTKSNYATVSSTPLTVTQTLGQPSLPFGYGSYAPSANKAQSTPIQRIRIPQFVDLKAEREFRKLHQAVALRWLGMNGFSK